MSGQSAAHKLSDVRSAISEVKETGGISEMETSAIGGEGRKGGAGDGSSGPPTCHRIDAEFMSHTGESATQGNMGYNSGGAGKTF